MALFTNALRIILETETDADSPDNEETYSQIRENIEALLMLMGYAGVSGTLTANPPNTTTGVLTDGNKSWTTGAHNGRQVVITGGIAKGNIYTIDDTGTTSLTCTGDNLYADGVRAGNTYKIFYHVQRGRAHNHDGVNSAIIGSTISQPMLKTSMGSVSTGNQTGSNLTLPGGQYGFYPQIASFSDMLSMVAQIGNCTSGPVSYRSNIFLINSGGPVNTVYAQQRYVTSSGEVHWYFVLREKRSGRVLAEYESPDHPSFGNGGKPQIVAHPFSDVISDKKGNLFVFERDASGKVTDNKVPVEIIAVNPTRDQVEDIIKKSVVDDELKPDPGFLKGMGSSYAIDEIHGANWCDDPVTVDLPKFDSAGNVVDDWRFMPRGTRLEPVKKCIPQPDFIEIAKLKGKA